MERRLHLTLADQSEQRYLAVPFGVAPGTDAVEITLERPDGAVIDLGCEGPAGFRGWSGGARQHVVIARDRATPGYLPGLEPGEWHVVLGLHQLPAEGVDVTVTVSTPATADVPAPRRAPVAEALRGSERRLPAPDGLTWFAGDCHAHTEHSDGELSIDELAGLAAEGGLDFIAVTDHNTVSHHANLADSAARHGVALLPGQEVTTHRGHANAYGDIGWVDFREPAAAWVRDVEARGGLLSLNHPIDQDCAWRHPLPALPGALEIWHISWFRDLTHTGAWAYWSALTDHGARSLSLLGGSDFHAPAEGWRPGTPTTWVAAEANTPDAILAAMRAGRTAISVGVRPDATPDPFHTPVLLRLSHDVLLVDLAEGMWLVDRDGRQTPVTSPRQEIGVCDREGPFHLLAPDRRVMGVCS